MIEQAEDDMSVIQKEAQAWVVRLASGQVSERDAQVFRHWCARSRKHATRLPRRAPCGARWRRPRAPSSGRSGP